MDFAAVARSLAAELERAAARRWPRGCAVDGRRRSAAGASSLRHAQRRDARALRRLLRGRSPRTGSPWRRAPPPDPRIVPFRGAYLYLRPERRELVRGADLPGARPLAAVPRRAPHPPHRRRGVARPERAAVAARPARPALAGHLRMARRWWRTGVTRAAPRRSAGARSPRRRPTTCPSSARRLRRRLPGRAGPGARPRRPPRGRLRASRRPSARCTCATRPRRRPPRRSRSRALIADRVDSLAARMRRLETRLDGPGPARAGVHGDERGFFLETFRASGLAELGIDDEWVQDNHSRSGQRRAARHALPARHGEARALRARRDPRRGRGHPAGLAELRQLGGRSSSTTSPTASSTCPDGFAHGFCVLSEVADVLYKLLDLLRPRGASRGFRFDDPDVGIEWPDGVELADLRSATARRRSCASSASAAEQPRATRSAARARAP